MRASAAEVALLHHEEGCVPHYYIDHAGVESIGWGHTGFEVVPGLVWTQAECDAQFALDLEQRGSGPVRARVTAALTQGQFDALSSLVFNIGGGNFGSSTLLGLLNAGKYYEAGQQFCVWNKSGRPLVEDKVLVLRRARELWLFARSTS